MDKTYRVTIEYEYSVRDSDVSTQAQLWKSQIDNIGLVLPSVGQRGGSTAQLMTVVEVE